jgi:hypothetical protein
MFPRISQSQYNSPRPSQPADLFRKQFQRNQVQPISTTRHFSACSTRSTQEEPMTPALTGRINLKTLVGGHHTWGHYQYS